MPKLARSINGRQQSLGVQERATEGSENRRTEQQKKASKQHLERKQDIDLKQGRARSDRKGRR